jgi:hypothetical protein
VARRRCVTLPSSGRPVTAARAGPIGSRRHLHTERRLAAGPAWRRVEWRNGTNLPWAADFAALRVTPATDWRHRRPAPEVWLLCERGLGPTGRRKHCLVSLPAAATLAQVVRLAHQRWAAPYADQRRRVCLFADGTDAASHGTAAHLSAGAGPRPGNLHGPAVYQSAAVHALDEAGRTALSSTADLTKS